MSGMPLFAPVKGKRRCGAFRMKWIKRARAPSQSRFFATRLYTTPMQVMQTTCKIITARRGGLNQVRKSFIRLHCTRDAFFRSQQRSAISPNPWIFSFSKEIVSVTSRTEKLTIVPTTLLMLITSFHFHGRSDLIVCRQSPQVGRLCDQKFRRRNYPGRKSMQCR